jgi:hypothetical protein
VENFLYSSNKFDNINQVKQGFADSSADSLSNIGSQETKQWQELIYNLSGYSRRGLKRKLDAQNLGTKIWSRRLRVDEQQILSC